MTTDHTAAAERHREDANTANNAGAYARAQVAALTAISHSIDALVAELVAEHHPTIDTAAYWPFPEPSYGMTPAGPQEPESDCLHDETRLNPDGSETCLQCDSWSRYGWHPDTSPAAEQDPLELELDGDDPTVEQHRPDLAAYGRHGYIPAPYSGTEA